MRRRVRKPDFIAPFIILGALGLALVAEHTRTLQTTGPLLVIGHLAELVAGLVIVALSAAIGIVVLRKFVLRQLTPLESILFGVAVGVGVLATSILAACLVIGVHVWSLGVLLAGLVILFRAAPAETVSLIRQAVRDVVILTGNGRSRLVLAWFALTATFLFCLALAPPSDWDSLMYHLEIPTLWLREGKIFVPEGNIHTALIGVPHMLYLPLVAIGSVSAPAVVSAAMALLVGLVGFGLCSRFFKPPSQNYLLAILWGSPAILLVAITPRVDVTLTLFTLLAHFALLLACFDRVPGRWLELAAVLLGFAFGVKYQAGLYGTALLPLILVACMRRSSGLTEAWRPFIRFAALAVVAASPWLLKNALLFHAPFSPFLAPRTVDPWLASILGGSTPVSIPDSRVFQIQQEARTAFNLADAFLHPGRLSIETESRLYFLCPVLLLLPLWILAIGEPILGALGGPALIYLALLLLPFPETNLRYLIPAIVPLTIVATVLAVRFSERLPRYLGIFARASLVVVCLLPAGFTMSVWLSGTRTVQNLIGATSDGAYLRSHFLPYVRASERVTEFANRTLRPESRVLMLYESRGLYFNMHVIEDTRLVNWPQLAAALRPGSCLEGSRITHILAGGGTAAYYERRGVSPEVLRWKDFERFAAACLTPIYADTGATLYRVGRPTEK